jgi:hypothetical protein
VAPDIAARATASSARSSTSIAPSVSMPDARRSGSGFRTLENWLGEHDVFFLR